ncbi:MAG: polysaccharide deacetylase family protein [Clostridia bacterium]|nr:polysaccharide deacetylase family protein [Clostridia bacterium]
MFVVLKRKQILRALIAVVVFVACVVCLTYADVSRTVFAKSARKVPVYRVDVGEEKVVAISFDAAWGADKTRKIVELLRERDVKATFFLVGFWVDAYKEEVAFLADSGMEIGNHSKSHLHMSTIGPEQIKEEVEYVNAAVRNLTGVTPRVFRAPFGEYDDRLISAVESAGMIAVQWDVDSLDWKGISGEEIARRVVGKVTNGSVILCHNNSDHILDALPTILDELIAKGYRFVTMSELIYTEDYTIDAQGVQRKNQKES